MSGEDFIGFERFEAMVCARIVEIAGKPLDELDVDFEMAVSLEDYFCSEDDDYGIDSGIPASEVESAVDLAAHQILFDCGYSFE